MANDKDPKTPTEENPGQGLTQGPQEDLYGSGQPQGGNPTGMADRAMAAGLDAMTGMQKPNGDSDAIQEATSPIDFIAPGVAKGAIAAGEALAPAAGRFMADEAGVVDLDKAIKMGVNAFAPIVDEGLAAQIPKGMSPEQTQAYLKGLSEAYEGGKLNARTYQSILNILNPKKNYADGGAVDANPPNFDSMQPDAATPTPAVAPEAGHLDFDSLTDDSEKYSTAGQTALAGLEGAAKGALGPLATGAEAALSKAGVPGLSPEDQKGREEASPIVSGGAQALGFVAPALASLGAAGAARLGLEGAVGAAELANTATKFSQMGALEKIGQAGTAALGMAAPEGALAKIGSAAVKGAIETAAYSGGDTLSKMINGDPNLSAESAITEAGLAAAIGGVVGGSLGAVSPLWQATLGKKADAYLVGLSERFGGIEGGKVPGMSDDVAQALEKTGLGDKIDPTVMAGLSDDPFLRNAASTLNQRDTGWRGPQYQKAAMAARDEAAQYQAETLGTKLGDIPAKGDIDKYTTGRNAGETLAKEYDTKISPIAKEYEAYAEKFANKELAPSIAEKAESVATAQDEAFGNLQKANRDLQKALKAANPEKAIEAEAAVREAQTEIQAAKRAASSPGVIDDLQQRIAALVEKENWGISPSSDIMREVARVQKELPNIKTLKDLTDYIKRVGENMASDHPHGLATPVSRAGGMIKSILRGAESDVIASNLNPELLAQYRATQTAFSEVAKIKDAVESRLGARGSVTNYAKSVRAMSSEEGEKVLRKLSGAGDADWLASMQEHFPETAGVIKQHHIDSLIAASRDGDSISTKKLMTNLDKMSPQMRDFILSPEQQAKLKASSTIIEALNDRHHNWSNTARTADKLGLGDMGGALAAVSALTGHGGIATAAASAVPSLFKLGGDEARHALLKFLGSTSKADGGAFKAAADYIGRITKGESLVTKATQNVFKKGADVLPASKMPNDAVLERLDKRLASLQKDPAPLTDSGGKIGHYMPEHSGALGETNARVVNYVNSQRPQAQKFGPLDPELPPSKVQMEDFHKVLEIAQQPLTVVEKIKDGSLTPQDVIHLTSMYPKMYDNLVGKLTKAMTEHMAGGEEVPYHTRIALSLFMGQPLDSTMTPEAIIAAQPKPAPMPQQGQMTQPKHSTAKLGKLPNSYLTANQAAEKNNQPKK